MAAVVTRGYKGSMPVEQSNNTSRRGKNTTSQADLRRYVCRNCGNKGHSTKDCRQPQRCYNCHKTGHLANACPTPNLNTPPDQQSSPPHLPTDIIASAVSGSWVREYVLAPEEYCGSILRVIWNIVSRGARTSDGARLLKSTIVRRLHLEMHVAEAMCDCRVAYGTGPLKQAHDIRHSGGYQVTRTAYCLDATERRPHPGSASGGAADMKEQRALWRERIKKLPKYAIRDYVASSEDFFALRRIGISLQVCLNRMLEASFDNLRATGPAASSSVQWHATPYVAGNVNVSVSGDAGWARPKQRSLGMLCTLMLPSMAPWMVAALGSVLRRDMSDVRRVLRRSAICIMSAMTYSDGCSIGKSGYGLCNVRTDYHLYV